MTDQHDHPRSAQRRDFLRNSLFAGAGVAAVALTLDETGATTPTPSAVATDKNNKAGYHETRHIRDYYRSASF